MVEGPLKADTKTPTCNLLQAGVFLWCKNPSRVYSKQTKMTRGFATDLCFRVKIEACNQSGTARARPCLAKASQAWEGRLRSKLGEGKTSRAECESDGMQHKVKATIDLYGTLTTR